ncbi:hypothetical protein LSAT2_002174, partial [Lamellibrachia satsuma]
MDVACSSAKPFGLMQLVSAYVRATQAFCVMGVITAGIMFISAVIYNLIHAVPKGFALGMFSFFAIATGSIVLLGVFYFIGIASYVGGAAINKYIIFPPSYAYGCIIAAMAVAGGCEGVAFKQQKRAKEAGMAAPIAEPVEMARNQPMAGNQQMAGYPQMVENPPMAGNQQMAGNQNMAEYSQIGGNPQMTGNQQMMGYPQMAGNPQIAGNQQMAGNQHMAGYSKIWGNAQMTGYPQIAGNQQMAGYPQMAGNPHMSGYQQMAGSQQRPG